jgi:nucleotide-binding universal stress UspA family protein
MSLVVPMKASVSVSNSNDTAPPFLENIVHPTDFSAASDRAFAHALAFALVRRARLTILHVGTDAHTDWSGFPGVRTLLERWQLLGPGSTREAVFDELGVKVSKRSISSRFPAQAVANYLDEAPADLLVAATEGRDGAARWLHGSVAEAMARRSRTMTLFVPADAERGIVSQGDGTLTLKNVLIPIDHAPDASHAIEFARRAAGIIGDGNVVITLLHVGAEADMPAVHAENGAGWTFSRMRREGDPVEAIVAAAELLQAELIVMPTAGRAGVFEALRGSTTERVLRHARCLLLAVPASGRG